MKSLSRVLMFTALLMLGYRLQMSYAVDQTPFQTFVNFVESYNAADYKKAAEQFVDSADDIKLVLEKIKPVFGNVEVVGQATTPDDLNKVCKDPIAENCLSFKIRTKYWDDKNNGIIKDLYDIKSDVGGKGFMVLCFPGNEANGELSNSKLASISFYIPKEGNFMGYNKAGLKFNEALKELPKEPQK